MSLDITTLPFNRLLGIRRDPDEPRVMVLEENDACENHIGTVHAGAIYALAESCSGNRIIEVFGPRFDEVLTVLRRSDVKYRAAATGTLKAEPQVADEDVHVFLDQVNSRGRGLLTIDATVRMTDDTPVLQAAFQWYVVDENV